MLSIVQQIAEYRQSSTLSSRAEEIARESKSTGVQRPGYPPPWEKEALDRMEKVIEYMMIRPGERVCARDIMSALHIDRYHLAVRSLESARRVGIAKAVMTTTRTGRHRVYWVPK